jgi:uncharacterized repeat protein (TIGR02543 family)
MPVQSGKNRNRKNGDRARVTERCILACVVCALLVFPLPRPVHGAADYWDGYTELSASAGGTLNGGNYKVTANKTITNDSAGGHGLRISGAVTIYIKSGVTLTVNGGNGSGTTGGGAGVYLPSGATLRLRGEGTLAAKGGNGGAGATGGAAGAAYDWNEGHKDGIFTLTSGAGGAGGGGAGAGVGTGGGGGAGGAGAAPKEFGFTFGAAFDDAKSSKWLKDGADGNSGYPGGASEAAGALYVLDTVKVNATGGSAGSGGAAGASTANHHLQGHMDNFGNVTWLFGRSGGGGGGGAGGAAANIGSGGGGGGGGGSGGTGGSMFQGADISSEDDGNYSRGEGGSGGANNGAKGNGSVYQTTNGYATTQGGSAGQGGAVGSAGGGGAYYRASTAPNITVSKGDANAANSGTAPTAYTVTYDPNVGTTGDTVSGMPASQNFYSADILGQQSLAGEGAARTGYTFLGWDASSSATTPTYTKGNSIYQPTGNVTLYAIWRANTYTVTLDRNSGSGGVGTSTIYQQYRTGWYTAYNSGTYTPSDPIGTGASGNAITPPTRTGYTYNGHWDTSATSGGTQYLNNTGRMVANAPLTTFLDTNANNNKLYARWTANTYTVNFYRNHSSADTEKTAPSATYDTTYAYPTLSRTGYTFKGWSTGRDSSPSGAYSTGNYSNLSSTNQATVDRYAIWQAISYKITYNVGAVNGHTISAPKPADGIYTIDLTNVRLAAAPKPTNADKSAIFIGWKVTKAATAGDGFKNNVIYASGGWASLGANSTYGDVELTAQWISPVGTEALSEVLTIPANTFDNSVSYVTATVNTYLNGALSDMDSAGLYQSGKRAFSLAGKDGVYSYTADSTKVSGVYDVYVNGENTGKTVNFGADKEADVYFYNIAVTTKLDGVESDVDKLTLVKDDDTTDTRTLVSVDPGTYAYTKQVTDRNGDAGDWKIYIDGKDTDKTVAFEKDANSATIERFTARVELYLDDEPYDGRAVTLKDRAGGEPDIPLPETAPGVFTLIGLKDDATAYGVYADGEDTGESVTFTQDGREATINYYTLTVRTHVDRANFTNNAEALSDVGAVIVRKDDGADLELPKLSPGVYGLVGQEDQSTSYEVFVNGEDTGGIVRFTSEDHAVDIDYFTVTYGKSDLGESGDVPVDAARYLSGSAVTLMPSGNLSLSGYTFAGWQENGGDVMLYRPEDAFVITARADFTAVWRDDDDAEAKWTLDGSQIVHYGLLLEALQAAKDTGADIELLRDYTLSAVATLGEDDTLTVPEDVTFTITPGGILTNGGALDNSDGKIVAVGNDDGSEDEDDGRLYNDNTVRSADAAHLGTEKDGYAASRVTYNANGYGSLTAPGYEYVKFGDAAVGTPPTASDSGHAFTGWFKEEDCLNRWNVGQGGNPVVNAMTLYAGWEMNSHSVTFLAGDHGDDPRERSVTVPYLSTLAAVAPAFAETGYALEGWYEDEEFAPASKWDLETDEVTRDLTLHARWTVNMRAVSFDLSPHPDAEPKPSLQIVSYGALIEEPSPPQISGYNFGGWYAVPQSDASWDADDPWDFGKDVMPDDDLKIYSAWYVAGPVTVSFSDPDGYAAEVPPPVTATPGGLLDYPLPSPASDAPGYSFGGWYKDEGRDKVWYFTSEAVPPHDITLYASWQFTGYTVTFDLNGHGDLDNPPPFVRTLGDKDPAGAATINAPDPAPTTTGYAFGGWYRDKACTAGKEWDFGTDLVTDRDVTLYAKWTAEKYGVTFDLNGQASASPAPQPLTGVPYGDKITEPDPAPSLAGHTFLGWYRDPAATRKWNFQADVLDTDPAGDLTLYAGWLSDTAVRVSFNMNGHGGDAPRDQWIEPGQSVAKPDGDDPKAVGYEFGGWYIDKPCTTPWIFAGDLSPTEVPADGATIYAKWTAEEYDVLFDLNGQASASPAPQPLTGVPYGDKITEPDPAPSLAGYTFLGWYRDKVAAQKWVFANDTVSGDLKLYAGWRPDAANCKVLFDMNLPAGATLSGSAIASVWTAPGAAIDEPAPAPEAKGYVFGGWYTEKDSAWNFAADRVNATMTLHAKWTPAPCVVRFAMNGHGRAIVDVQTSYGAKLAEPATPSESGWVFGGWYTDLSKPETRWDFAKNTVPAATYLSLYALWHEEDSVEVSFDLNTKDGGFGGDENRLTTPPPQWPADGGFVTAPKVEAEGWSIEGWYTDKSSTDRWDFEFDTVAGQDVTLYAKWKVLVYTVDYEMTGRGRPPESPTSAAFGSKLSEPVPPTDTKPTPFDFGGWYKDASLKLPWDFDVDTMPARNLTLYASWHSKKAIEVVFVTDKPYEGNQPYSVWVEPGSWIDEPTPELDLPGYSLGGWRTEDGEPWSFETPVPGAGDPKYPANRRIELRADWTANTYEVLYDTNGYGNHTLAPERVTFPGPIKPPADPVHYGYEFGGWYTEEFCSDGARWDFAKPIPPKDMTLYAKWTIGKYTVSYVTNGHGTAPADEIVIFGRKVTEPPAPTAQGYIFGGWYKSSACADGTEWRFVTDTMPGEKLTLYAKWTVKSHTITYDANGHGTAPAPLAVNYGDKIAEPASPTAEGYAFEGWYTDREGSSGNRWAFPSDVMPDHDLTLYAKWTENPVPESADQSADQNQDKSKKTDQKKDKRTDRDKGGDRKKDRDTKSGGSVAGAPSDAEGDAPDDPDGAGAEDSDGADGAGADDAGDRDAGGASADDDAMSSMSIILVLTGAILAVCEITRARRRSKDEPAWVKLVIPGLAALNILLFFLIEDISANIILFDRRTPLFSAVLAAEAVLYAMSGKRR